MMLFIKSNKIIKINYKISKRFKSKPDTKSVSKFNKKINNINKKTSLIALSKSSFLLCINLSGFIFTNSGILLSEAMGNIVSLITTGLLYIGSKKALEAPTKTHQFGYNNLEQAFSLLSSMNMLLLGGGVSLYHGIVKLLEVKPVSNLEMAISITIFLLIIELISLFFTIRNLNKIAKNTNKSFIDYIKTGTRTTSINIIIKDTISTITISCALTCLILINLTGNSIYDSIGTLIIGSGLIASSLIIISKNLDIIAGKSFSIKRVKKILKVLEEDSRIKKYKNVRTNMNFESFSCCITFDESYINTNNINEISSIIDFIDETIHDIQNNIKKVDRHIKYIYIEIEK